MREAVLVLALLSVGLAGCIGSGVDDGIDATTAGPVGPVDGMPVTLPAPADPVANATNTSPGGPPEPLQEIVPPRLLCKGSNDLDACQRMVSGPGVNEYSVAVNPKDPDTAVVTANDYGASSVDVGPLSPNPHRLWGSWWVTHDAGATWTRHVLPGRLDDPDSALWGYEYVGDLVTTFDDDGNAHIAGIAYTSATAVASRNAVFHTVSTDGGETFRDPVLVDAPLGEFAFHDKPAIAIDQDGRIILAWLFRNGVPPRVAEGDPGHMRIAISEDGGQTWTARPLSHGDSGISASIAVTPDNAINIAWRSYDPLGVRFARSSDHGRSFSEPVLVHAIQSGDTGVENASYRAFVLPTLVSLPDGTLLLTSGDRTEDHQSNVSVYRSTDDGATWTGALLGSGGHDHAQFLPTVAVDADGTAIAAWLDRRDDPDDEAYRLYAAVSTDGGLTWYDRAVSTTSTADPNANGPSSTFIGDYIGADVHDGRAYFAWPDIDEDGGARMWTATLDVATGRPTSR